MKKLISKIAIFILVAAIFSCKQEDLNIQKPVIENTPAPIQGLAEQSTVYFHYFYNGVATEAEAFDPGLEASNTLVLSSISDDGKKNIDIHGFSTEENFFIYGDAHNIPLRERRAVENHLAQYAISSGAIAEYEKTGIEPTWYNTYVTNYLVQHKTASSIQSRAAMVMMYDDCFIGASAGAIPFLNGNSATMYAGLWNNKVSAFEPLGIWGFDTFYDNMFFGKRLATWWKTGFEKYHFCDQGFGFINNKTSSWLGGL
jgi:hypothetical protein